MTTFTYWYIQLKEVLYLVYINFMSNIYGNQAYLYIITALWRWRPDVEGGVIRRHTTATVNQRHKKPGVCLHYSELASAAAESYTDFLSFVLSSFFSWECRREQLAPISCHSPRLALRLFAVILESIIQWDLVPPTPWPPCVSSPLPAGRSKRMEHVMDTSLTCFCMNHQWKVCAIWPTMLVLIRPGDETQMYCGHHQVFIRVRSKV